MHHWLTCSLTRTYFQHLHEREMNTRLRFDSRFESLLQIVLFRRTSSFDNQFLHVLYKFLQVPVSSLPVHQRVVLIL